MAAWQCVPMQIRILLEQIFVASCMMNLCFSLFHSLFLVSLFLFCFIRLSFSPYDTEVICSPKRWDGWANRRTSAIVSLFNDYISIFFCLFLLLSPFFMVDSPWTLLVAVNTSEIMRWSAYSLSPNISVIHNTDSKNKSNNKQQNSEDTNRL